MSPTEENFLDTPDSDSTRSSSADDEEDGSDHLAALRGPGVLRLPWASGDSGLSWPSGSDTVDSEVFPITDIKEEPESPVTSSSDAESQPRSGETSPIRDEPLSPPTGAEVNLIATGSNHSASSGHLNQSFSASDEELNASNNKNQGDQPDTSCTISGDTSRDPADTFQDFRSSPKPIPQDVEASTPMTYVEPKVIVVDNGTAADSNDTMEDLFHSNNNVALDTTPVLEPTNNTGNSSGGNNSSNSNSSDPEENNPETKGQSDDVTYDEGYGTGKFLPEGETPLLPPTGPSPGIQHHLGKQRVKAKKGSTKSKSH